MAKRKHIALVFRDGYDDPDGTIVYIKNILKGLSLLDDIYKSKITVIYSAKSPIKEIKQLNYPYIDYYLFNPIKKNPVIEIINILTQKFLKTNLIKRYSFPKNLDILYPYFESSETHFLKYRFYWNPGNFSNIISNRDYTIVFDNEDSLNQFKKDFSPYKNQVKVLRSVSVLAETNKANEKEIELLKNDLIKTFDLDR